jgi:hypothetical protein
MADQTPRKRSNIVVSPTVKKEWDDWKTALEQEEGRSATDSEIIGALVKGVPLWQADLMVRTYIRHASDTQEVDSASEEEGAA